MPGYTIRAARAADVHELLRLIRDLASYEKALDQVKATEDSLQRNLFGEKPVAHGLVVEEGDSGQLVGMALYFFNFSTWTEAGKGIYLEDLFVSEIHRKAGLGKRLFAELGKIAREEGCARLDFQALDWNTPSINFYKALGADVRGEWLSLRLEGKALADLEHLA